MYIHRTSASSASASSCSRWSARPGPRGPRLGIHMYIYIYIFIYVYLYIYIYIYIYRERERYRERKRETDGYTVYRPRMQAAGLQCLSSRLGSLFPIRKTAHFPVCRFPGKLGHPNRFDRNRPYGRPRESCLSLRAVSLRFDRSYFRLLHHSWLVFFMCLFDI